MTASNVVVMFVPYTGGDPRDANIGAEAIIGVAEF